MPQIFLSDEAWSPKQASCQLARANAKSDGKRWQQKFQVCGRVWYKFAKANGEWYRTLAHAMKTANPTITAIITTYRRPKLLKRAILSVLKQTYPHFQICIYDNASDDETEKIVHGLMRKDARIKYHRHLQNIGMMGNYAYAFSQIETPYYALLSDDDYLLPNFYETAIQGFKKHPDAAFSACGVLQMDEAGKLMGDTLSLWKTEGYYSPPEGLLEMISTRCKFPVPTGVLFQTQFAQTITPDLTEEIKIYWDPNYLIQIAAKYSIVIQKKPCAIYQVHSGSFAGSFYQDLLKEIAESEKYLIATCKILSSLKSNLYLNQESKMRAYALFLDYVQRDVIAFMKGFMVKHKFAAAQFLAQKYRERLGLSLKIQAYCTLAFGLHSLSLSGIWCFELVKRIRKLFLPHQIRKILFPRNYPSGTRTTSTSELNNYHVYGQNLFDEPF